MAEFKSGQSQAPAHSTTAAANATGAQRVVSEKSVEYQRSVFERAKELAQQSRIPTISLGGAANQSGR